MSDQLIVCLTNMIEPVLHRSRLAPGDSVYQDNAVSHRIEHADLAEPSPFTTRR